MPSRLQLVFILIIYLITYIYVGLDYYGEFNFTTVWLSLLIGTFYMPLAFIPQFLRLGSKYIVTPVRTKVAIHKINELESLYKKGIYSEDEYQEKLEVLKKNVIF